MSRVLRRKVEDAITGYLQTNAATLGLTSADIVSANSQAERPDPCLVVAALSAEADEDLAQVAAVQVQVAYYAGGTLGGSERAAVDTVLEKTHMFLMKPVDDAATWGDGNLEGSSMKLALNKPASGADSRTVTPLHIYDISPSQDSGDIVSEGWVDELVYDVLAQPMNSH